MPSRRYVALSGIPTLVLSLTSALAWPVVSEASATDPDLTFVDSSERTAPAAQAVEKRATKKKRKPKAKVSITATPTSVPENTGTATFTITVKKAAGRKVTVKWHTKDGTATAGSDYTATAGKTVFKPRKKRKQTATIDIPLINDHIVEPDETFDLVITKVNVKGGKATTKPHQATLTITDDDTDTPAPAHHTLSITKTGNGDGTITSRDNQITCGPTCTTTYPHGTQVVLTATPATGSVFTGWTGDCTGTDPECTITLTDTTTVQADFKLNTYELTITPNSFGTITSHDNQINCPTTCTATYDHGTEVTLTATPNPGFVFTGWTGDCTGTNPCTLTMDSAKSATPGFALRDQSFAVIKAGNGTGAVTSADDQIDCGTTCAAIFSYGTSVTLTAIPGTGSTFTGWTGDHCSGTSDTCTVEITEATIITATFTLETYDLAVTTSGDGAGTITSDDNQIGCPTTCTATYDHGTEITLTATPDASSVFVGWTDACADIDTECTLTIDDAKTAVATFALKTHELTVGKAGTGTGTITSDDNQIHCGTTCAAAYDHGTEITLTATPETGSEFIGWTGACTGTIATCTLTIAETQEATAHFSAIPYLLTVTKDGTGTGTVTAAPYGIDCGETCASLLAYGATVTLTATADPGSEFTGWSGACTGTDLECTISIDGTKNVTATFDLKTYPLTIDMSGKGAVTSTVLGVNCAASCAVPFIRDTEVALTQTAAAGYFFDGWGGDASHCVLPTVCTVTIDGPTSVTAVFKPLSYPLAVAKKGDGAGAVTADLGGIDCGPTCSHSYKYDQTVTLTADPAPGSDFAGWTGGGCSGTGECAVTINGGLLVSATFRLLEHELSVTKDGSGTGSVTSSPAGINCGADCAETYDRDTEVTLTATPAPGSAFTGWTGGGCTGTAPCTVTMDTAHAVSATFTPLHELTVTQTGNGAGAVVSTPAGIECGVDCSESYLHDTMVTLTATPATSSVFTGWTGDCTGTGPCTVTMDAAKNVTASFTLKTYTLTVANTGNGNGTITSSIGGISCGANCTGTFNHGDVITLTAAPATGSTVTSWAGAGPACAGANTTCTLTITATTTIHVKIDLISRLLVVTNQGQDTGSGTVTSDIGAIDCGDVCARIYNHGDVVILTATPSPGSTFAGWSGSGCTGTGTCVVTMDATKTVTATFTRYYTVAVNVIGERYGLGSVDSTPIGLACGLTETVRTTSCSASFKGGQNVQLNAITPAGSTFAGWSGDCTGATCTVTLDRHVEVTAIFRSDGPVLTVTPTGDGTGVVTSAPGPINCQLTTGTASGRCSGEFDPHQEVELTAVPAPGTAFEGWSGAGCSGTAPCTVTMSQAQTVSAHFKLFELAIAHPTAGYDVGVRVDLGDGEVVDCVFSAPSPCVIAVGTPSVVLVPVADPILNLGFDWNGNCENAPGPSGNCEIALTGHRSIGIDLVPLSIAPPS